MMNLKREINLKLAQLTFTSARLQDIYKKKGFLEKLENVQYDLKKFTEEWDEIREEEEEGILEEFLKRLSHELLFTQQEFENAPLDNRRKII